MAVTAAELVLYCSTARADDDTSTVGGSIDTACRPLDSQWTADAKLAAVSDSTADTRTLTYNARISDGTVVSTGLTLTGTVQVASTRTYERILDGSLSSASTATVTVTQSTAGATRHTFNPNETDAVLLFRKSVALSTATRDYYEKFFWKNTSTGNALLSGVVNETSDSAALYTYGLSTAVNDSETTANRLTAPSTNITFTSSTQAVPGTDLAAGDAIGIWFKMTLGAAQAAAKDSFKSELSGETSS